MYEYSGRPTFDDVDAKILAERAKVWNKRSGPRVGDFVRMLDNTLRRFTHDWGDGLQVTCTKFGGSFHLCDHGAVSYSGALDPAIPKAQLAVTKLRRLGSFWFFHHNEWRAHNGVHVNIRCRVFREVERPQ